MQKIPDSLNPNLNYETPVEAQPAQPEESQNLNYYTHLLQKDNNALIEVPQDKIDVAVRSGKYLPKNDAEFVVLDKYDNTFTVPGSSLKEALENGYRIESPEFRYNRELQEQYGGVSGQAKALVSRAVGSATLGASDVAGVALGKSEELAKLQEANPVASTVGEIIGTVGGLLIGTGEAGLIAKGAGAGMKAVQTAGAAAEKAVLKSAIKAGVPKNIARTIAVKGTGGAAEGAVIGAGQLVSENALGKADFNAENLAAYVGTGAIMGGAANSIISAASLSAPYIKKMAKPIINELDNLTSREAAALDIMGYTPAKAAKLSSKNPQMVRDLPDFLTNEVKLQRTDGPEELISKISAVKKDSGELLGSTIKKYDEVLQKSPELQIIKKDIYQDLATKLDDEFLKLKSNSPESRAKLKQAGAYYDELVKSSYDKSPMTLKQLQEARQNAYKIGYSSTTNMPVDTLEGEMARFAGRYYSEELKRIAAGVSEKTGTRELYSEFLKAHKVYTYTNELLPKISQKAFKKSSGNLTDLAGGAALYDALLGSHSVFSGAAGILYAGKTLLKSDLYKNMITMGELQAAQNFIKKQIDSSVKYFNSNVKDLTAKSLKYSGISILDSAFAQKYDNGKYKKPKSNAEAFSNMHDNFERYKQDPEAYLQRINRSTSAIYKHAPDTSTQLDALAVRGGMFLASKMPKRTSNSGIAAILQPPKPPSKLDLAKFERYLTAVEEPKKVFEAMKQGRLAKEHVEAFKVVYPNLYGQLQNSVIESIKKNPQMPYNKKLQLGVLLDLPVDESMQPENVLGLQSNFALEQPEQSKGAVNSTVGGMQEIDKSGRSATSLEATEKALHS